MMAKDQRPAWWRRSWRVLRELYEEWRNDNATLLAAAVAFFAVFSLGPLLLIIVAAGGMLFSEEAAQREVVQGTARLVNPRAAMAVERLLETVTADEAAGVTVVGIGMLLFGASAVFRQLRVALNLVLDVPNPPEGWRAFVVSRLIAVVMVIGTMCLLGLTVVMTSVLTTMRDIAPNLPAGDVAVWRLIDFAASTLLVAAVFGAILKWVPTMNLRWAHVWKGAVIAATIFSGGRLLLGMYLRGAAAVSIYGAAASLFVALVMVYFGVLLILLAAEITAYLGRNDAEFSAERTRSQHQTEESRAEAVG